MEMIKAQLANGIVTSCIVVSAETEAGFAGVIVPVGLPVSAGWTFDGSSFSPPVPPPKYATVAEAQDAKRAEIRAARDAACYAPVTALGHTFQADARSQELLSSTINLASSGLPLPAVWRSLDDVNVPVTTIAQLLAIAGAMAVQTQAAYGKWWQLKTQIAAAKTIAEIEAITWVS